VEWLIGGWPLLMATLSVMWLISAAEGYVASRDPAGDEIYVPRRWGWSAWIALSLACAAVFALQAWLYWASGRP
jgi:hypothetical protein